MSEEGVAAAIDATQAAWTVCLDTLPDCDEETISDFFVDEQRLLIIAQVRSYAELGISSQLTETRRSFVENVSIDESARTARAVVCEVDATVLVTPEGEISDDRYATLRRYWDLVESDGRWRVSLFTPIETAIGEEAALCG